MKRKYLKWIITFSVICIVGLALMGASGNYETDTVKGLLEKRSVIMENVLFGKITYEEGKKQLKEIEKDKLYNDDLKALSEYKDTDLEIIEKMDIVKLEKTSCIYDRMTFCAIIRWTIAGMEKIHDETHEYNIGVDVSGGKYRLISFEIQGK